jgi:hypothetical protein
MRFSLETLQAGRGDCMIVHFGRDRPRFIVVDGGVRPTYKSVLRPRLEELKARWKDEETEKLHVELLLISHIDDDHIAGVVALMRELHAADERGDALPYLLQTIWHNSFEDLLGRGADALQSKLATAASAVVASSGAGGPFGLTSAGVIASVEQGREVRTLARQLGIPLNSGFDGLIVAGEAEPAALDLGEGLTLRVLGPSEDRLRDLQREWEKVVRRLEERDEASLAAFVDKSVSNLSSIIALLEAKTPSGTKRVLLTGDARGDDLLQAIEKYGLLSDGTFHVDVFKVPHHGSDRNSAPELFRIVTADEYVISANGEHGNPDPPVIKWILDARKGQKCRIHMTNAVMVDPKTGKDIAAEIHALLAASGTAPATIAWPEGGAQRSVIDLGDVRVDY